MEDLICSHRIDIECLEETKLNNPSPMPIQDLSPRWHLGGIVIGVVSSKVEVLESTKGEYIMFIMLKRKVDGWK